MANLARIKDIQARFADRATFLTVYTQEYIFIIQRLIQLRQGIISTTFSP